MTRTEQLMNKGLSADEALKVVVFADQGLRWIKGTNGLNHQKRMDDFIGLIETKPNETVRELADYIRDNYYAKDGEDINKKEFERRWLKGESMIMAHNK